MSEQNNGENVIKKFDLKNLRLDIGNTQNFEAKLIIQKIPIRKPNKQEFFQVHPGKDYRIQMGLIQTSEDRQFYGVAAKLSGLIEDMAVYEVCLCINRQKQFFLWPIKVGSEGVRLNPWIQSAHEAAFAAQKSWVKVAANMAAQSYDVYQAIGNLSEPDWSEKSFEEILEIAFRGNFIENEDHFVIKELRGAL